MIKKLNETSMDLRLQAQSSYANNRATFVLINIPYQGSIFNMIE